jgi:5-(carboxyamino)imidazole ribonucleotide synthase
MSPVLGVIGAGQLARMMIAPATELGIDIRVFAENEGESARLAVSHVGDAADGHELLRFVRETGADAVTFDHEHVPQAALRVLVEAGVAVRPGPHALLYAQDKLLMRDRLGALGLPMPDWASVESAAEIDAFLADHGGRAVLKTPRGGYDGKGVRIISTGAEANEWWGDGPLLIEELVRFQREVSQLVARRPNGELALWPLVETVQRDGVCAEVIAPAPGSAGLLADAAADIATTVAESLDVTGVLAVELFHTTDDRLLINELAMRPHNTGHWTQEGSTTSQFEQHVRAVLDLPLGGTGLTAPFSVMVNILGGPQKGAVTDRYPAALADQPDVAFHAYGKSPRPGRKVGHVTATGDELDDVVFRARAASEFFQG